MRELKREMSEYQAVEFGRRTPLGVRELKLSPDFYTCGISRRTPLGVRELKLLIAVCTSRR